MIACLQNVETNRFNAVDKSVFRSDAARPVTLPFVPERFWLTNPAEWVATDVGDQCGDASGDLGIGFAPPGEILLRAVGEKRLPDYGGGRDARFLFRLAAFDSRFASACLNLRA